MRNPRNEPLGSDRSDAHAGAADAAALDAEPRAREPRVPRTAQPERKCVLSNEVLPRETMLRLAIGPGPDGAETVLPDALAKAPGRGAWIGATRAELEAAMAKGHLKGALARAFKSSPPTIPADLAERVEAALTRTFADRLGIEYRSGNLIAGSDRIAESARSGKVRWLAHAADAREDGARRLDQAWRVGEEREGSGMVGIRLPLDRAALSVALGRDNVVHLALTDGAAAGRVSALLARLNHFLGRRPETGDPGAGARPADVTAVDAGAEPGADMGADP